MKLKFYEDDGHGWLEVPKSELKRLGLVEKISPYSYQKDDMAYLEEDCDASAFVDAKIAKGEMEKGGNFSDYFQFIRQDGESPIRNYECYFKGDVQ